MSLESKIVLLIAALEANTAAIAGNVPTVGAAPLPATATPAAIPPAAATPAPNVPAAPAAPAAAPAIPPAAVPPAAASPSNVTIEQLHQEITAIYQNATPEKQAAIGAIIQQYGNISSVPVDQTGAVLASVRGL